MAILLKLKHCLMILSLLFMVSVSTVLSYTFKRLPTEINLMCTDTFKGKRSYIECGTLCSKRRLDTSIQNRCVAFRYRGSNGMCKLYVAKQGGLDASGVTVYKFHDEEGDASDPTFQYTTGQIGLSYAYNISNGGMTFQAAKDYCQSLGAHLIHIDSADEFNALGTFLNMLFPDNIFELWVGAQDIQNEGDWVDDKYSEPLDFLVWRFRNGEPNNWNGAEDCGCISLQDSKMVDVSCNLVLPAVCELTL